MRLYHVPNSSSQRVLWLLEEIGQPYELEILGNRASRLADAEHMRRHPLGRVPVLEDDERLLFESAAICFYLAEKYPEARLLPPPATIARGLAYQWSFFGYTEVQPKLVAIFKAESPEAAADNVTALEGAVTAIAEGLGESDFLVEDRFGVADVLVGSMLGTIRRRQVAALPASLSRYLDALEARPAKMRADDRNPAATAR